MSIHFLEHDRPRYLSLVDVGEDSVCPSQICFAGDSAGGALCLQVLFRLRVLGKTDLLPRAMFLGSPWVDLADCDRGSFRVNERLDIFAAETVRRTVNALSRSLGREFLEKACCPRSIRAVPERRSNLFSEQEVVLFGGKDDVPGTGATTMVRGETTCVDASHHDGAREFLKSSGKEQNVLFYDGDHDAPGTGASVCRPCDGTSDAVPGPGRGGPNAKNGILDQEILPPEASVTLSMKNGDDVFVDPRHPLLSPAHAEDCVLLESLPAKTLIVCGERELFRDQITRFFYRLQRVSRPGVSPERGGNIRFEVFAGMCHVFFMFRGMHPTVRFMTARLVRFLDEEA